MSWEYIRRFEAMVQSKTPLPVWLCSKPLLVSASLILSLFNMLKLLSSCDLYCFISPIVSAFDYADLKFILNKYHLFFGLIFFVCVCYVSDYYLLFFFWQGCGFLEILSVETVAQLSVGITNFGPFDLLDCSIHETAARSCFFLGFWSFSCGERGCFYPLLYTYG